MHKPNLLLCVVSNSELKTRRFIDSLIDISYKQKSRSTWGNIYLLRVTQHNSNVMFLSSKRKRVLENLNINFVQCSIDRLNDFSVDPNIIFPITGGSYSIAGQRNRTLLAINELIRVKDVDLVGVLDDDIIFENAVMGISEVTPIY